MHELRWVFSGVGKGVSARWYAFTVAFLTKTRVFCFAGTPNTPPSNGNAPQNAHPCTNNGLSTRSGVALGRHMACYVCPMVYTSQCISAQTGIHFKLVRRALGPSWATPWSQESMGRSALSHDPCGNLRREGERAALMGAPIN